MGEIKFTTLVINCKFLTALNRYRACNY